MTRVRVRGVLGAEDAVDQAEQRGGGAADVLEVWDIFFDMGMTYQISFNTSGADLKLLLFGPSTLWAGRNGAILQRTGNPAAVSYVAPETGYYGLVVVNDDGASGTYDLQVTSGLVDVAGAPPPPTGLRGIAPNPAGGAMQISFTLHETGRVSFDVFDVTGRRVHDVPEREWAPGKWSIGWTGTTRSGRRLAAGVYFLNMKVSGRTVARRKFTILD